MSITLRNVSGIDQGIVYRGKQLILGKDEEQLMDDDVADEFKRRLGNLVQEAVPEIGGIYEEAEESVVWIANMTGDPDASPTVKTKALIGKGQWGTVEIQNPLKEARTLQRTMGGPMVEQMGKAGVEGLNTFGTVIEVPPYQRRKLPVHIAKWFLGRNSHSTPGAAIKSRPKSNFEPDMKWELDETRLYLELVEPGISADKLGQTYKKIKADVGRMRKSSEEELRRRVRAAKEMLMKRLHRRLADPRYRLPTQEEFAEFKAQRLEDDAGDAPQVPVADPLSPPPAA